MAKKNSLTFPSVKESRWSWSRQSVSPPLPPPPTYSQQRNALNDFV